MKILLTAINAKYIHSNLAIYSLRAYAIKQGINVDMAEYTINQQPQSILRDIYTRQPDFVGFSCYIWNIELVKKIASELHKVMPECHIWFGGPEVSYDVATILDDNPYLEGIMMGEGEVTFVEVIRALQEKNSEKILTKISGVALQKPRSITAQTGYIDMDILPFPYEDFVKYEDDLEYGILTDFDHRIIYYESGRGCPYSCSYCLSSVDKCVRYRSIELVKKELKIFLDAKVPQVKFVDRTFNCNRERTRQIWDFIMENDNGITNFHFEVSADIINDDELAQLKKMREGLVQLEIGVQTTNPDTIAAIHRKMDFEKLKRIVTTINENGNVHLHLDLIAGLPYEGYDSFAHSFNDVYKLRPQQLQLGFLKVLKGSYMHETAEKENIIYSSFPPYEVLCTPWLPYEKVLRLKGIEDMVENYYNSGQFTCSLALVERLFCTPFSMYEFLAGHYEKNNYADIGHSRIRRYEILKEAVLSIKEVDAKISERLQEDGMTLGDIGRMLDEALTFDLYVRENMKSRPVFARDKQECRAWLHSFYTNEEELRQYLPDYGEFSTKQIERMTDVEFFEFNVKELRDCGKIKRERQILLFDYRNTSRITGCARIVEIQGSGYPEKSFT